MDYILCILNKLKLQRNSEIIPFEGTLDVDKIFRKELYEADSGEVQEEALYVCNLSDVLRKFINWRTKMPRVKPFYAVKCNDDDHIIQLLARLGSGFDCASKSEIKAVLKHNVSPDRIIFANPAKATSHIRYAAATETSLMTFDSTAELDRIYRIFPAAQLVLRFRCDSKKALCSLGAKFGCDPSTEAHFLLLHAKNLNLSVVGVSFMVGSGCGDPTAYSEAISIARELFDYALALGYHFRLLDIGGGFPGDTITDFEPYADAVNAALEKFFPQTDIFFGSVEMISEPGTYFVESACTVATTIVAKNEIFDSERKKVEHVKYYVNDGIHGSFNLVFFGYNSFYPRVLTRQLLIEEVKRPLIDCSIWGPTCNSLDKICANLSLPNLEVGDVLVFPNVGNYSLVFATNFNGFPKARVLYFADKDTLRILRN
uniref:ornithine decarboxylase n=1 Tax=Lutzomyia longipalpis TaxID=7200 RepID=A0A1B0CJD9_LUTLO